MTMPNYIVNWDEMYQYLVDNLDTLSYNSIKDVQGVQKSIGFNHRVQTPIATDRTAVVNWRVPTSMIITAISLSEDKVGQGSTWTVKTNNKVVMDSVRSVSGEHKTNWKVVQPLNEGDRIEVFKNRGSEDISGRSWVNIEYIDVLDNLFDVRPQPPSIPSLPEHSVSDTGLIIITATSLTGESMDSAAYELLDIEGRKIKDFSVGYNGVYTVRANVGNTYQIKETRTPEGHFAYRGASLFLNREKHVVDVTYVRRTV